MMAHPKVSIIIPVYNEKRLLHACLDSATHQTLKDIEIICVDDASTDTSPDILSEYTRNDERIRIIKHEKNKGEGTSRNTGLDNARGEYIFHLDADDTIPLNALELLYTEGHSHGSDMVKGGFVMTYEDGRVDNQIYSAPKNKIVNTNIHKSKFLQNIPTSHCTYLYKKQFLDHYSIRYRTDLVVGLDLVALATALVHAENVTLIPDIVHHYHQSETSVIRGPLSLKIAIDAIRSKTIINDLLNTYGMHEAADLRLQNWNFIIATYWQRIPSSLTTEECSTVFSDFRALVFGNDIIPWTTNTPHHYRYILALVLANQDEKALTFLRTKEAMHGFSSKEKLKKCLKFILTQAPEDVGALMELGHIAASENRLNEAISFFEEVLRYDASHLVAQLNLATTLHRMGRYDKSHERLNIALASLIKGLKSYKQIKRVISLMEDLYREELNTARNELNTIYNTSPSRITKPLRKIKSALKQII
jgi:glycosyltransferase involved in cell wall biosynthesis